MLALLNSSWHFKNTLKTFRGIQFKDLKHLIDTNDKVWEGETSQSSVVNNARRNELHNEGSGRQSTVIKCMKTNGAIS